MGKDTRLQFRITEDKKERAERCAKKVKIDLTTLGVQAVEALCDYIEANHEITSPFVVIPESAYKKLKSEAEKPHCGPEVSTTRYVEDIGPGKPERSMPPVSPVFSTNEPAVTYRAKKPGKPKKKTGSS